MDSFSRVLCLSCTLAATPALGASGPEPPPSPGWEKTVRQRVRAESHAIRARSGSYSADLRAVGLVARFGPDGVVLEASGASALALRTVAWGRAEALHPFSAGAPGFGACTADLDA